MLWLWVVVVVVLIGIVTVVAVGSGDSLAEVYDDRPDRALPAGRPLTADDLADIRFTTAVRGYRMDEVDALVARMRADLLARETSRDGDDGPDAAAPRPTP
ncbi:MAG: DivIVA domain-containing protein [Propionibacteriales bacterium]|nr:DivIVA domain-containing protein [Propionibacteriales bacterium]